MTEKYLPLFIFVLALAGLSSCRQDNGSPVRNVRFDPNLLNQLKAASPCASYSYFYEDQEKDLGAVFTKQILMSFKEGSTYEEQKSALEKYAFVAGIGNPLSAGSGVLYTIPLVDGLNCSQTEEALKILAEDNMVAYAAPFFLQQANLLGVSNEVIVTVQDGDRAALESLLQEYGASVVSNLSSNVFVVNVDKNSKGNALELANYLKGQEGIAHAEPNFVISEFTAAPMPGLRRGKGAMRE